MSAQPERECGEERSDFRAKASPPGSGSLLKLRSQTRRASPPLRPWFQVGSFAPAWMPKRLSHPLFGYLVAALLQVIAVGLTLLLSPSLPAFAIQGALSTLGIVVIALNWGGCPGVFATLVGTGLTAVFVEPYSPRYADGLPKSVCMLLFLLIGFSVSLIASQRGWACRHAEEIACSLRKEQAKTDQERRRLRTLLDVLPAAVGMVDGQGRFLERTPACTTLWGAGAPAPRAIDDYEAVKAWWPDSGQRLAVKDWGMTRALTRGEVVTSKEVEIETFDGKRKVVLDSATPIRDETGAIIGAVGLLQDITERKRLEREAAERAAQLETIFESITDGLIVTDQQGRVLRMNRAIKTMLDIEDDPTSSTMSALETRVGFTPLNAQRQPVPEAERPITRYLQGEVLAKQQSVDLIVQTRDGREYLLNNTGGPIRDETGRVIGAVEVIHDVTEQRRLEQHTRHTLDALLEMAEALVQVHEEDEQADLTDEQTLRSGVDPTMPMIARRLAELTRSVLGGQYVGIVAIDPETEALTPITIVGVSPEQERDWWVWWDRPVFLDEDFPADFGATLHAGKLMLLDDPQLSLPLWPHLPATRSSFIVPMQVGESLVGGLRVDCGAEQQDFTCPNKQAVIRAVARLGALVLERVRLLRERAEARASELALREAQAQMESFLGMAGHELKTPLTSMKLSLQLAERRVGKLAWCEAEGAHELERFLDYFALAGRQAERLERLVNDLLDVSRVQAGKLEHHPEPVDLTTVVSEAVEEQRQAAPTRALAAQFPADAPVPVIADADRIGQVVTNYLTNALKYSAEDCCVEIGIAVEGQQARVWVRDEGPGLPAGDQARIWERFYRAPGIEVQSGSGIGLGLGLHICRTIIERHQGQVGVRSTPGEGSTFWFTLPLAPAG